MMRYLCASCVIIATLSEVSIAQTATVPASTAAPVAMPSAAVTTAATDELVTTLKAQIAEMRRSEDRLLSNIHWTLGTVVALALGLGAFSWWSSKTVYDRDIAKMKEE